MVCECPDPLEPDPEGLMTSGSLGGGQCQASEIQKQTCPRGAGSVCWRLGFPLCPDRLGLRKWNEFNLTERGKFAWRRAGREWKGSTLTFCHVIQERERGVRERERLCVCARERVNVGGRGMIDGLLITVGQPWSPACDNLTKPWSWAWVNHRDIFLMAA